ncbi:BAF_HP2_G0030120.mRNA.1.CDS.1 [Saccharomyces cerevisiae]|nr:BAF_HP2_G0030120.mRNA.1.CDS.1 [Saccharomyces cerevisiae]CAI6454959.1 BAF_HP2_G0030120.mRNA.1.CDS.1 [Saccharomyces cerevisiae]
MYGLEKFFSRIERVKCYKRGVVYHQCYTKGRRGHLGDMKSSSEDALNNNTDTYGNFIRFERNTSDAFSSKNLTMKDAINMTLSISPE